MYNKLFTKILDSSIWLEEDHVRLVWITFLAVKDQDGVVALSGIGNVAARARISEEKAADAIRCLESPDNKNPDQENEGRRIERIPGVGWFVLNAEKYDNIIRAETLRAQNRERQQRSRAARHETVTPCHAPVTQCHENVTLSDTDTDTDKEEKERATATPPARTAVARVRDERVDHPAVQAIRMVTNRFPDKALWDKLIEELGVPDLDRLRQCHVEWVARGFKPINLAWAFEWYKDGIPEKNNGTNKQNSNGKLTTIERIKAHAGPLSEYPSEAELGHQP